MYTMDIVNCKESKCMCEAKCNRPKSELKFALQCFNFVFL